MHVESENNIAKRFFTMLDGGVPTSWNIHRVHLDLCPSVRPSGNSGPPTWLASHVTLMFSHRERALRDMKSSTIKDTFVNLKDSLQGLFISASGVQGPVRSVFALQSMSAQKILAFIFVTDLRLDVASHTVIADACVVPGTETIQDRLRELEVLGVVAIRIDSEETEAWRHLLPVFVERCRTWTHRPSCEYLTQGTIPLFPDGGAEPEKSLFCSCGVGVGTGTLPLHFKSLAPYATRVAISPLFAVPYLEKVGPTSDDLTDQERCGACGKRVGSLSLCGKCKKKKYCSRECQVKDWKVHKKNCT